jgi:signal transduction histidine kinase
MFTEKNLPRLIIATPILSILLFAGLIIFFFIKSQYSNFEKESMELEREYLASQKRILQDENEKVLSYIQYHRGLSQKRVKIELEQRLIRGEKLTPIQIQAYKKSEEKRLKKQIISWIESVRYGANGYVWVHDTAYRLIAHPFRQNSIGNNDYNNTDSTGAKIFQKFINAALKQENNGFVEYYWAKPEFGAPRKKIGYLKLYKPWGWAVGTGLYVDDIISNIQKKKDALEKKINKYIGTVLSISFGLIVGIGMISFLISKNIVLAFTKYALNVAKKEKALKELNFDLQDKIDQAVIEVKKKDKTLLQQSRLAQMGEMISMIAHQWRQPLSELAGIFMELETAAKFGKIDLEYIQKESVEGNRRIEYMSKTIDDFRNFFKPSKKKEAFSLAKACKEAVILANAALANKEIKLLLHVKQNSVIQGYPSEFAQVIFNLILNAKDALIENEIKDAHIHITIGLEEYNSFVFVEDNAGGINPELIEKIFDPYFSTKKISGTGLGLYMAKMIIEENMQGELSVQNSNVGARFIIRV